MRQDLATFQRNVGNYELAKEASNQIIAQFEQASFDNKDACRIYLRQIITVHVFELLNRTGASILQATAAERSLMSRADPIVHVVEDADLIGSTDSAARPATRYKKKRPPMSAEARAAIGRATKARWERAKKEGRPYRGDYTAKGKATRLALGLRGNASRATLNGSH
jgi:hypothetical protein